MSTIAEMVQAQAIRQVPFLRERIFRDPAASFWLKCAIEASEERDLVDAVRDAEALIEYLQLRYLSITGRTV